MTTNKRRGAAKLLALLLALVVVAGLALPVSTFADPFEESSLILSEDSTSLPESSTPPPAESVTPQESAPGSSSALPEDTSATDEDVTSLSPDESEPGVQAAGSPIQPASLDFLTAGSQAELVAAIASIANAATNPDLSGTITITDDFDITSTVMVPSITLTIKGGSHTLTNTAGNSFMLYLGAYTSNQANVTIEDLTLNANSMSLGVMVPSNSIVLLERVTIQNARSTTTSPSSLTINPNGHVTLRDSVIENGSNTYFGGTGAIYMGSGATLILEGETQIRGNSVGVGKGMIHAVGGRIIMRDKSTITGTYTNRPDLENGAIFLQTGATLEMYDHSSISGNAVTGLTFYNPATNPSSATLYDNAHISENINTTTGSPQGGGVCMNGGGSLSLYGNSHISGNQARLGGGIFVYNGTVTMNDQSLLHHNTADSGGGMYLYNSDFYMLDKSQINYNTADNGGGIYLASSTTVQGRETTIIMGHLGGSPRPNTASFFNNEATEYGGAIYMTGANLSSDPAKPNFYMMANVGFNYFYNNTAGIDGGAIHVNNTVSALSLGVILGFNAMRFSGNHAGAGAYLTVDPDIISIYDEYWLDTVKSISLPTTMTPYVFNNYDIGYTYGTPLTDIAKVEFYVDGDFDHRVIVEKDTPVARPTEADLLTPIPAGYELVGWYTDEQEVGNLLYEWNFGQDVPGDMDLFAALRPVSNYTVTVNYYTQEQWYTNEANDAKATTATETLAVPTGDPLATHLNTLSSPGVEWYDLHLPAGYADTLVVDEASLPTNVTSNLTIYVVYRKLYTVTVNFYKNAETTRFATGSVSVPYGETPEAALVAAWGAAWYNEKHPGAPYHDGVFSPDPLETIYDDATITVRYRKGPHAVQVLYYQDASGVPANLLSSDSWSVNDGVSTQTALENRLGAAFLNAHNPDPSLYRAGVVESPTPLPATVEEPLTIVIVYTPFAASDVTFYRNHSPGDDTVFHTEYGVIEGRLVPAPTPVATPTPEAGYAFDGWYTAATGGARWNLATQPMPATSLRLYAQYTPIQYQVTYDYSQVTTGNDRYVWRQVYYGDLLPTVPTDAPGYIFQGWLYNGSYWSFGTDTMPAGDIILTGVWTQDTTTGGSSEPPAPSSEPSSEPSSSGGGNGGDGGGGTPTPSSSSRVVTPVVSSRPASSGAPTPPAESASAAVSSSAAPAQSAPVSQAPEEPDDPSTRDIDGTDVPLNWWQRQDGWSLLNLVVSLLLLISAILQLVRTLRRRDAQAEKQPSRPLLILAAISGILPIILLPILETFSGGMLLLNKYSPLFIALALIHAALIAAILFTQNKKSTQQ